jgi:hypothetical protein
MDAEYIIDSAAELGEITPLECAALYLINSAYGRVDRLLADKQRMPDDFLQNTARIALSSASPDQRHWVALNSLRSVEILSRGMYGRAEYILQKKIQSDLNKSAPCRLIEGSAENDDTFWTDRVVTTEADVTETAVRTILGRHMGGFLQRLKDDNGRLDKAILWYQQDNGDSFRQLQGSHRATMHTRESLSTKAYELVVKAHKARKRIENKRPVRGAIKKVTKLFAQFKQEDNLRLFVSGHEVELAHPESQFKFILRPLGEPGWLEERSAKGRAHTPYDLSLLTKDDVFISKLCVYFSDTPVLDQLLALSLFVQAGDELKVLEKANFFSFAEGPYGDLTKTLLAAYPSLAVKFPKLRDPVDKPAMLDDLDELSPMRMWGAPFEAEQVHWEPFKGRIEAWVNTWFDPVFSQMLPKAKFLQIAH